MPKLFCAIKEHSRGEPQVDWEQFPQVSQCHCESVGEWGLYLLAGTGAQLSALNALPEVVGIVAVTESGETKWAELDGVIAAGVRTRLNAWLSARGHPTIPEDWTYRRVVEAVFKRAHERFDLNSFDLAESS